MRKKIIAVLLALLLCLGLVPSITADNDVIFTSLNDNLLPLSSSAMPYWSDGVLYAPLSTFDARATTINLDVYASYNDRDNTVTVYNLTKMIIFDLEDDSCYNYHTNAALPLSATSRNGIIFLPINMICDFFDLDYSYQKTDYGPLLRVKSDAHWLDDALFIDAASTTMSTRLREYNQNNPTAVPEPDPTPDPPPIIEPNPEPEDNHTPVLLSILCDDDAPVAALLDGLTAQNSSALFLLTPDQIEDDGDGVRQILASGHPIGLWAEGETLDETRELLQEGLDSLAAATYSTTTIAQVPTHQQESLEAEGWVCWQADQSLTPDDESDPQRYTAAMVRALAQNGRTQRLSLTASPALGDCLSQLLIQLEGRSFHPQIITEMMI